MPCGRILVIFVGFMLSSCGKCDRIEAFPSVVKECHVNVVTYFGDPAVHWNHLKAQYSGCTHVMGNLDISFLEDPNIQYDLTFLENIRYVSGYVAIFANNYPRVVALPKLEVIRGNQSFPLGSFTDVSLLIGAIDHQQVYMPRLKEVTTGNVYIGLNTANDLCYLDTIDWTSIVRDGRAIINRTNTTPHPLCPPCSRACHVDGWGSHCWGLTDDLCQWPPEPSGCDSSCRGRCVVDNPSVCCHDDCAIGCHGPTERDCMACIDYQMSDGSCVSHCPYEPPTYPQGQDCVPV